MHDKHGREIHGGDIVIGRSWVHASDKPLLVLGVNPATETCNVTGVPVHVPNLAPGSYNSKEVVLAVKANGTIVNQPE